MGRNRVLIRHFGLYCPELENQQRVSMAKSEQEKWKSPTKEVSGNHKQNKTSIHS